MKNAYKFVLSTLLLIATVSTPILSLSSPIAENTSLVATTNDKLENSSALRKELSTEEINPITKAEKEKVENEIREGSFYISILLVTVVLVSIVILSLSMLV